MDGEWDNTVATVSPKPMHVLENDFFLSFFF